MHEISRRRARRLAAAVALASWTLHGCLGAVQGNLDLLLSPGALDNAWKLPYSAVWSIFEVFLKARGFF
jgi:hypothetical protein